jgi:predicted HTH domain antitoxin
MTLELPDQETREFTPAELRLELACALFARGLVGKVRGAHIAGVDFFEFQRALGERQISSYTSEMLHSDLESLKKRNNE